MFCPGDSIFSCRFCNQKQLKVERKKEKEKKSLTDLEQVLHYIQERDLLIFKLLINITDKIILQSEKQKNKLG